MRLTALAVKIILLVVNEGPNRHSAGLSSGSLWIISEMEVTFKNK